MASLPTLRDGIALTHSIVAADVERATRFYSDVLAGEPSVVTLASSWIIINSAADRQTTSRTPFSSHHSILIV